MNNSQINCLGFIMDGNRRWAKQQGLHTLEGHRQGQEVFLDSIDWVVEAGIPHAVYYAFSTENWNRKKAEVEYLMDLFRSVLQNLEEELKKKLVQVRIVGRRADFAEDIQELMKKVEEHNSGREDTVSTIWIALSYGGRDEIVSAVNQAIREGEEVDEVSFSKLLMTADMPDPDMIVRTGGEERLSNFMTWKSVYSELYFTDKQWPALTKSDFNGILNEYENRERRRGK